ncbi:helix-turn-helix domain-containing protein [Pseudomonas sp. Ga0074129]|uniref:helix-turn-helix domain-containing protein n=1 Tax=Pseudomonas sp. Ga0074129 TaxID=1752219 RepID=UPI0026015DD0|nr:helix-turn-helix domain-containing protein [Pseudomonas sp. Ga0074129]
MSIKAMNWAWEQNLPPGSKLVLMALADNADDQGYCWPKIKTIAAKCCVSERTAQRTVKDLLDSGLLKISARFNALGGQVSNGYTLEMYPPDKLSPSPALIQAGGDSRDTPGVTQLCRGGSDTAMSPLQPPHEPKKESSHVQPCVLAQLPPEEQGEIMAIMDGLSQEKRAETKALLINALTRGKIHTTPSRWLRAVIRRRDYVPLSAQAALGISEQEYEQKLIQGGIPPEVARFITGKTISSRQAQQHLSRHPLISIPQVSINADRKRPKPPRSATAVDENVLG